MTKQIFSSHKNPHYYYEKEKKQNNIYYGNLRASRLLRSYLIAEKKLDYFINNRKYNVKECSSNYCCSEKYIYTCLDKYFIVYFPCF